VSWLGEAARGKLGYLYAECRPATDTIGEGESRGRPGALAAHLISYLAAVVLGVLGD